MFAFDEDSIKARLGKTDRKTRPRGPSARDKDSGFLIFDFGLHSRHNIIVHCQNRSFDNRKSQIDNRKY